VKDLGTVWAEYSPTAGDPDVPRLHQGDSNPDSTVRGLGCHSAAAHLENLAHALAAALEVLAAGVAVAAAPADFAHARVPTAAAAPSADLQTLPSPNVARQIARVAPHTATPTPRSIPAQAHIQRVEV